MKFSELCKLCESANLKIRNQVYAFNHYCKLCESGDLESIRNQVVSESWMIEGLRIALLHKDEKLAKYFLQRGIWIDPFDWIPNQELYEKWRDEIVYDEDV